MSLQINIFLQLISIIIQSFIDHIITLTSKIFLIDYLTPLIDIETSIWAISSILIVPRPSKKLQWL